MPMNGMKRITISQAAFFQPLASRRRKMSMAMVMMSQNQNTQAKKMSIVHRMSRNR